MMRLIAVMPDTRQVGFLVDSLRNGGYDRKDLIVSDLGDREHWGNARDAAEEISFTQTERDGLWEIGSYAEGVKGLKSREGILVAVELPKHDAARVKEFMEQCGAIEIVQD